MSAAKRFIIYLEVSGEAGHRMFSGSREVVLTGSSDIGKLRSFLIPRLDNLVDEFQVTLGEEEQASSQESLASVQGN